MASMTFVPHVICKALHELRKEMNGVEWQALTRKQQFFLETFFARFGIEAEQFSEEELKAWISQSAEQLNKILNSEGFDNRLDELQYGEVGIVAILDIMSKWLKKGQRLDIISDGKKYPGVKIKNESVGYRRTVTVYSSSITLHPIVALPMKSGDHVFMTKAFHIGELPHGFTLFAMIRDAFTKMKHTANVDYVHFPMIDIDEQPDISWLIGMPHTGGGQITQALQQTKFKMNEVGAYLKSDVAMATYGSPMPKPERGIIIDEPFYLWIMRGGVGSPILCAYCDRDTWKDPGELEI